MIQRRSLHMSFARCRINPFRSNTLLLVTLMSLVCCLSGAANAGKSLQVGDKAPNWILATSNGETISFYQNSVGKKSVILFWATWCPYCAEIMPKLEALQEELNDSSVQFYALNIWEDGDALAAIRERTQSFTFLLKADMVAKRYNVQSTPGVYVVGDDRTIQYVREKNTSVEQTYLEIKQLLESK